MTYYGGIIIVLSAVFAIVTSQNLIQLSKVDALRRELNSVETELLQKLQDSSESIYNPETTRQSVLLIVKDYAKFGNKLDKEFPNHRDRYLNSLKPLWIWAKVEASLQRVEGLYSNFRRMQTYAIETPRPTDEQKWRDFAETVLNDTLSSVPADLFRIFDMIIDETLFISAYQETNSALCNDKQSPQQLLYNLYNSIAVTEIKGYAMMQFSWLLLKLYKQGVFTEENQLMRTRYEARMGETLKAVTTAMAFASQDIWTCDPPMPRDSKTYTELTWFLQSYIVNEVDLNSENTCRENCAYYNYAKTTGCFKNQYCSQQRRCNGKVYNCQYIDSDMWICPASANSGRRYEYIEYENGRTFGKKGVCTRGTTKVDSWWRWLFWHCSYCVCHCDDHSSDSDRYFNMREVTANIDANKVITGIKFVKVNRVIHLQIEQGKLLERGRIDAKLDWKPVENYTVSDIKMRNGMDYFTMSWDARAIDLDDLTAAPDHLLTGVRFRNLGSHLNLEIRSTPFNFASGTLLKDQSVWHGNDNTDVPGPNARTILKLQNPDRPTHYEALSVPDSKSDQYILFSPSDLDNDAGQSTVPFIDTQPVLPIPRIPIAGAGIYHKGRPGSGGYIAPKLRTYNFAPHLYVNTSLSEPLIKTKNVNN